MGDTDEVMARPQGNDTDPALGASRWDGNVTQKMLDAAIRSWPSSPPVAFIKTALDAALSVRPKPGAPREPTGRAEDGIDRLRSLANALRCEADMQTAADLIEQALAEIETTLSVARGPRAAAVNAGEKS